MTPSTITGNVPSTHRLASLRALVFDCDGVLTPGDLYYDDTGRRLLRFNSKDGFALALLCRSGLSVGVLSGRPTDIAERRLRELGVRAFAGQCRDKAGGLTRMCEAFDVPLQDCAFVGDDLPDLPAFDVAGLSIAVADAAPEVLDHAHWTTKKPGGHGAVREICEAILKARGDWQRYLHATMTNLQPPAPAP